MKAICFVASLWRLLQSADTVEDIEGGSHSTHPAWMQKLVMPLSYSYLAPSIISLSQISVGWLLETGREEVIQWFLDHNFLEFLHCPNRPQNILAKRRFSHCICHETLPCSHTKTALFLITSTSSALQQSTRSLTQLLSSMRGLPSY